MPDLVSVIITLYNGEKYLEEQMKSVLDQTYDTIEIIIVDDCSSDSSFETAKAIAVSDRRVKIYRNDKNMGVVGNFLKGILYAKGEYILFCDQDDYWRKDKIDILKGLLEKDDENMLAYSDLEICDNRLRPIAESFWGSSGIMPKKGCLRELSFLKNITPGCSMMFRKEVAALLAKIPPDAPFMHDHLALILASGLGKIAYSNERLVKYRQHDRNNIGAFYNSVIDKQRISKGLQEKVDYFRKLSLKKLDLNLDRMLDFSDSLYSGDISKRLSFIDCYLFLRNDSLWDKFLGLAECIMPGFYEWARNIKRANQDAVFYIWLKRFIFTAWPVFVLYYFTKEFVIYKLIKFLGYIK